MFCLKWCPVLVVVIDWRMVSKYNLHITLASSSTLFILDCVNTILSTTETTTFTAILSSRGFLYRNQWQVSNWFPFYWKYRVGISDNFYISLFYLLLNYEEFENLCRNPAKKADPVLRGKACQNCQFWDLGRFSIFWSATLLSCFWFIFRFQLSNILHYVGTWTCWLLPRVSSRREEVYLTKLMQY